jgi:uncharacterized beta-barrel protein YwiB (DUF1934 family)
MKTKLLSLAFIFVAIANSFSQVLWYGDPEKNYLQSFYRLSRETGEVGTVNTTIDPEHGKVWVLNKPSGDKRCEFARTEGTVNSYTPKEGDLLYLGWRMKTNIVGNTFPGGFAMFQWKSDTPHSQNYPFIIGGNGQSVTLSAYDAGTTSQGSRQEQLCSKNVAENTWVTIVLAIKVSRNENIGYLECWFDGVKQNMPGGGTRFSHRTLDDSGNYCKWGAYNEASRNFDISVYLDEMRMSTNFDVVMNPLKGLTNTANKDPNVTITSPANNATFTLGQTINLAATATDDDGTIEKVNFKIDGAYYSNDRTTPYTGTFTPTESGTYVIGARAFDDKDAQKEVSVMITVTDVNKKPTASFTKPTTTTLTEGYTELHVLIAASDPDGDAISTVLFIDGKQIRAENGAPYEWGKPATSTSNETLNLIPGVHTLEVVVTDAKGAKTTITKSITVTEKKAAYTGTPISIPGTIEMENYDKGGAGVSYFDADEDNNGEAYRSDAVDIGGNAQDGFIVGWTSAGEWLEYTIKVTASKEYDFTFRTSSLNGGGKIGLLLNGVSILSNKSIPKTNDWNVYTTSLEKINLTAGTHVLRFVVEGAGFNIDKIVVTPTVVSAIEAEQNSEAVSVFPNPNATGVFHLSTSVNWKVYTAHGVEIAQGESDTIDLSIRQKGIYLVKIGQETITVILE